jgi:hypothetical protein
MPATATDHDLGERLKDVQREIGDLRDRVAVEEREAKAAREEYTRANDDATLQKARSAAEALYRSKDELSRAQDREISLLKLVSGGAPNGSRAASPRGPRAWDVRELLDEPDVQMGLTKMSAASTIAVGRVSLGEVVDRDKLAAEFGGRDVAKADITGTPNMRVGEFAGVVPQLRRPLRVLDLLASGTTDGNVVPYTQESGSFSAAETAEGSAKPEDAGTYTDAEAPVVTIAGYVKVRKQALADFAGMQSILDGRLRFSVRRRLEGQVIAGSGSGANLTGILNTSGIGAIAYDADELPADQILRAITAVFLADAEATGIVMNPADWRDALIAKAAGDGHYYSGGPFSVTPQVMWGVPLVPSPAIAAGTALVGDFAAGAQLLIREGVSVLISDSDQDDFIKNRVTMLGEMRAALPVWRPAAFSTVDLAA